MPFVRRLWQGKASQQPFDTSRCFTRTSTNALWVKATDQTRQNPFSPWVYVLGKTAHCRPSIFFELQNRAFASANVRHLTTGKSPVLFAHQGSAEKSFPRFSSRRSVSSGGQV